MECRFGGRFRLPSHQRMKRGLIFSLLTCISFGFLPAQDLVTFKNDFDYLKQWNQSLQLKEKNQYREALDVLNRIIESQKIKADSVYFLRGQIHFLVGDFKSAARDAKACTRLNKNHHPAYFLLGIIQSKTSNFQGAIRSFTKAIRIDSTNSKYFYDRGVAYLSEEDLDDAVTDLNRAIVLQPTYAQAFYSRGYVLDLQGKTNSAIVDLTTAMQLDKSFKEPYIELASIYLRRKENVKACEQIKNAEQNGCQISLDIQNKFCQ
jgi:tetratricopeptide (TPR) repeat protein